MRLTVLMAAYNAETHIEAALRSVLGQPLARPAEIIVVDDGSTDGTAARVAALAAGAPQIQLIRTENRGVTAARNALLAAFGAREGFVSFLDADDLVPEGRFPRDLALFAARPELDLVFGMATMFREANAQDSAPAPGSPTATGRGIQLAAATYRAETLRGVGRFDESFRQAEDMDFLLRLFERQPRYQLHGETSLYYRRHGGNMTLSRDILRRDFARALMLSIRRRRAGALPPYPEGVFETGNFVEALEW